MGDVEITQKFCGGYRDSMGGILRRDIEILWGRLYGRI